MSLVGPPPPSWSVDDASAGAREVRPGLWRLRLPVAWDSVGHVNAYAIALHEGVMLADCGGAGHPSCVPALERALAQAGWALEDVRVLVGTHTHSDHVGLAQTVIERGGAAFWMHPASEHFYDAVREPQRIAALRDRRARAEGVPDALLPYFRDTREETEGVEAAVMPDHLLVDGVRLPSRLGEWEVVETPGHSPSHVSLVQREQGVVILGDLLAPIYTPYFDYGHTADPIGEFVASTDRIAAIGGLHIGLPGHGRPLEDLPAVMVVHRDGVAQQLAAALDAVRDGVGGAYAVSIRVCGEPASGEFAVWNMTNTMCLLRHLRVTGAIVRDAMPDGTFAYRDAAVPAAR